jgi:hypothetical protein
MVFSPSNMPSNIQPFFLTLSQVQAYIRAQLAPSLYSRLPSLPSLPALDLTFLGVEGTLGTALAWTSVAAVAAAAGLIVARLVHK